MMVCEVWLANDFLVRHGHEPEPVCHCPDCPPLTASSLAAHADLEADGETGCLELATSATASTALPAQNGSTWSRTVYTLSLPSISGCVSGVGG